MPVKHRRDPGCDIADDADGAALDTSTRSARHLLVRAGDGRPLPRCTRGVPSGAERHRDAPCAGGTGGAYAVRGRVRSPDVGRRRTATCRSERHDNAHEGATAARTSTEPVIQEQRRTVHDRPRRSTARLPDFRLETFFSRWEFAATHHLTASDAQTLTVSELLALGTRRTGRRSTGWLWATPRLGNRPLRELSPRPTPPAARGRPGLRRREEPSTGPWRCSRVPGTTSSSPSRTTRAGDRAAGSRRRRHRCTARSGRQLATGPRTVRAALRPIHPSRGRELPQQPHGAVPDHHTWRALVEQCDERGIRLLSDEVYRGLELDPARTLPQAADPLPDGWCRSTSCPSRTACRAYGWGGSPAATTPCWRPSSGQALHVHLQRRPQRAPGRRGPASPRAGAGPKPGDRR
jgi:hypothetical protein